MHTTSMLIDKVKFLLFEIGVIISEEEFQKFLSIASKDISKKEQYKKLTSIQRLHLITKYTARLVYLSYRENIPTPSSTMLEHLHYVEKITTPTPNNAIDIRQWMQDSPIFDAKKTIYWLPVPKQFFYRNQQYTINTAIKYFPEVMTSSTLNRHLLPIPIEASDYHHLINRATFDQRKYCPHLQPFHKTRLRSCNIDSMFYANLSSHCDILLEKTSNILRLTTAIIEDRHLNNQLFICAQLASASVTLVPDHHHHVNFIRPLTAYINQDEQPITLALLCEPNPSYRKLKTSPQLVIDGVFEHWFKVHLCLYLNHQLLLSHPSHQQWLILKNDIPNRLVLRTHKYTELQHYNLEAGAMLFYEAHIKSTLVPILKNLSSNISEYRTYINNMSSTISYFKPMTAEGKKRQATLLTILNNRLNSVSKTIGSRN